MTVTDARPLPMVLAEVEVVSVERLSPSFARIELGGPDLADVGVDGPLLDQRFKVILPGPGGRLPHLVGDSRWYARWLELPEGERGHLRTYTIRELRGSGADTRIVVDVVLHPDGGDCGPGAAWAASARPGDRLVAVAPRRGAAFGGIEFDPGSVRDLLLVGDETAVPAVASILEGLPATARGTAFLEVPTSADVRDLAGRLEGPVGVEVVWLPRDGAPGGVLLHEAVVAHLGTPSPAPRVEDEEVDPDLWETPTHSSSGEPLDHPGATDGRHGDLYAWIAGEARTVTGLRRHLVRELGIDRRRVAFMGYWRRGVALRS